MKLRKKANIDAIKSIDWTKVKEETGLDIKLWDGNQKLKMNNEHGNELIPPIGINRHFTTSDKTHEHINMVYFATANTDQLNPAEGEQQDGLQWCAKEDLQTMDLREDVKFYAELALETLGGK